MGEETCCGGEGQEQKQEAEEEGDTLSDAEWIAQLEAERVQLVKCLITCHTLAMQKVPCRVRKLVEEIATSLGFANQLRLPPKRK